MQTIDTTRQQIETQALTLIADAPERFTRRQVTRIVGGLELSTPTLDIAAAEGIDPASYVVDSDYTMQQLIAIIRGLLGENLVNESAAPGLVLFLSRSGLDRIGRA